MTRPLKRDLSVAAIVSLAVVALLAILALLGLFAPAVVYSSSGLRQAFAPNDAVSLILATPVLLVAMWLARRGRLLGLLLWPGALLFILYNTVAYLVALPVGWYFWLNALLAILGIFATIQVLSAIDAPAVKRLLDGNVPARWAAGTLAILGLLFFLRAAYTLGSAVVAAGTLPATVLSMTAVATLIADLIAGVLWFVAGVLLWRRAPAGYVLGSAVLFQAGLLFIGLLLFFVLQPRFSGEPFAAGDFLVIAAMSLVVLVPLAVFIRGIIAAQTRNRVT